MRLHGGNRKSARVARVLLIAIGAAAFFAGCSSEVRGPEFPRTETGPLYTFIGDAPACDIIAFRTNVSGMKLRDARNPENLVTLFPTSSLFINVKLDLAALRDKSTMLHLATAPAVPYDQVELTLASPQIVVYNPANDPPVETISGRLSSAKATAPLPPGFSVSKDKLSVLWIDFDMLKSIELDANGQVSGNVDPAVTATPGAVAEENGFGYFDNLVGFVTSVFPNPVGEFLGYMTVQLVSGSGPAITVYLNGQTDMYGATDLKSLETGRVVEIAAYVKENGSIVARTVEVEDRAFVEEKRIAFIGTVFPTPVRDANGNVTQFKFYVRAQEPDLSREVPLDSVVTVNVQPSTKFLVSSRTTNFANVPFDASALAIGQELIVHGQYTLMTDQPTVVDPSSIYLKLQTMQGGLGSLVQVGSDGKTGAFWLSTCSQLQQSAPILVLTNNQTAFLNVFGLAEIDPQATLLVRGLPFYQKSAGIIHGVPVPAGTVVFTARQVHQLQ